MRQKRIAKLEWIVDIHTGSIVFYLQSKPLHISSNNLILLWLIYAGNFSHWNCLVGKVVDLVYFNARKLIKSEINEWKDSGLFQFTSRKRDDWELSRRCTNTAQKCGISTGTAKWSLPNYGIPQALPEAPNWLTVTNSFRSVVSWLFG